MSCSPPSSGIFNGGTITDDVTIANPALPGEVLIQNAGTQGIVSVDGGSGTGGASLVGDATGGALTMTGAAAGTTWAITVDTGSAADRFNVTDGDTGASPFFIDTDGYLVFATHSAPASASLNAGECALWFDQTNGAAKLMVKAKQADGTVKTAAVALA